MSSDPLLLVTAAAAAVTDLTPPFNSATGRATSCRADTEEYISSLSTSHAAPAADAPTTASVPSSNTGNADWLNHSGLLRALCGLSAIIGVDRMLGLPLDAVPLMATFYLYWAAYVGDHLKDCRSEADMQNQPARSAFLSKHFGLFKGLIVSGGVAFIAALVAGIATGRVGPACLTSVAMVLAIVVAYPMKLLPGGKALKSVPGVKLLLIGACFALTVVLTAQIGGVSALVDSRVIRLALAFGLFAGASANLSDVHDIEGDRAEGVFTLAVLLGQGAARSLSLAMSVAAALALLGLGSPGAVVTGAAWVVMAATWTPRVTPLSDFLRLRKFGWLTFSVPAIFLG